MGESTKPIGPWVKTRLVSAMGDNTNPDDRSPLLPDRYPQQDFFVCDVFDAAPKGDMASMENPLFSISTRSEEHTSELQSLMRISYAVFSSTNKKHPQNHRPK